MVKINKLAVTGANGMVGKHFTSLLELENIEYINIDRKKWDLSKAKSIKELDNMLSGVDAFVHIGAAVPSSNNPIGNEVLFNTNVHSCVSIAEWALRSDTPVVYISGSTVYEDPHSKDIKEEDAKTTNNFGGFYGFSKYMGEQVFSHYIHKGLKTIIIRPSSIYGHGLSESQLLMTFLRDAMSDKNLNVQHPKDNKVNFVHASDVATSILLSLQSEAWGIYNIAAKECRTIEKLADICIEMVGSGMKNVSDSQSSIEPFIRFDLNCEKAEKRFSYTSEVTLEEGIKMMFEKRYF
jgi:UDP-glucose 4-epimerase